MRLTSPPPGGLNGLLVRAIGRGAHVQGRPGLFDALGRHHKLFRPWLRFAARLMPRGELPRRDSELVILRVSTLCDCPYEWAHHERIAPRTGLDAAAVARVRDGADAGDWSPRQEAILRAVDELHEHRALSDERWEALRRAGLSEVELIELPMLVGHYEMLAMTLNALQIPPDRFRD